jgi:hypothetical protein
LQEALADRDRLQNFLKRALGHGPSRGVKVVGSVYIVSHPNIKVNKG